MPPPPEHILLALRDHRESQDIGMMMLGNAVGITVIIMGPRTLGVGHAAVGACAMILNDLVSGNMQKREGEVEPEPQSPPRPVN